MSPFETRQEHIAWAKARALEYLDAGDPNNAFSSMLSDLMKWHEGSDALVPAGASERGMRLLMAGDADGLRHWIEAFQ